MTEHVYHKWEKKGVKTFVCTHCRAKMVLVPGPRGGTSLQYSTSKGVKLKHLPPCC